MAIPRFFFKLESPFIIVSMFNEITRIENKIYTIEAQC